jgi:hypothetical protein
MVEFIGGLIVGIGVCIVLGGTFYAGYRFAATVH